MKIKKYVVLVFCSIAMAMISLDVFAHNIWLNPSNNYPAIGETVDIGIGWGHKYPANRVDQEVKENTVEKIWAIDPEGQTLNLEKQSASLYRLKIEKPGVYFVNAHIKAGVFTMTTEGRKWANKKEVKNPIKCTAFNISAKTFILAGGDDRNLSKPMDQPLDLIPMKNPAQLKKGDLFPVKALFYGKPLAGFAVNAVYAGFESDTSSYDHGDKTSKNPEAKKHVRHFPVETITDNNGIASIPLDRNGYWMIALTHNPPYPDTEICDEYRYNLAVTFEVK